LYLSGETKILEKVSNAASKEEVSYSTRATAILNRPRLWQDQMLLVQRWFSWEHAVETHQSACAKIKHT